jgi:Mn2+/Fe2+ NRAMP family transporter
MAGDNGRRSSEDKLLGRLRLIAGAVILLMIVLLVTVDTLGRLFIDPSFRASELFLGTLVGALMLVLGIEVVSRLPNLPKGGGDK